MKKLKDLKIGEEAYAYRAVVSNDTKRELKILKAKITRTAEFNVHATKGQVVERNDIRDFIITNEASYNETEKEALQTLSAETVEMVNSSAYQLKYFEKKLEIITKELERRCK